MEITTKKLHCALQINLPAFCVQALILEKPFRKSFLFPLSYLNTTTKPCV